MAIPLVKMGIYNSYSDRQMYIDAGVIIDTLEKKEPIPEVAPLVVVAGNAYKAFAEAYVEAATRSTVAVAKKRKAKQALADSLVMLAVAVNYFAKGNAELLAETAMPMEKQKSERVKKVLEKPTGISAANCGNSGCVKVSVRNAIGAKGFVYQWTTEPVTESSMWTSDGGRGRTFIWEGLKPGLLLWFRVIAIGSGDTRLQSDAVSCMVI